MNDKKTSKKEDEELRLLYQLNMNEIRYVKRQQWTIPYYGLLLIAGVLGLYQLINSGENNITCIEKGILLAVAVFILVFGTILLRYFQNLLCYYRKRVIKIIENFSQKSKDIVEIPPNYTSFWYDFGLIGLQFVLILGAGVVFVWWILYR